MTHHDPQYHVLQLHLADLARSVERGRRAEGSLVRSLRGFVRTLRRLP